MKSWRNGKLASRGLSRAVLFHKSAFVASRARHRSRRGQSTFEEPLFSPSMRFARGRRTAQKISDRAPLVQFLLDKPLCVRGCRPECVAAREGPPRLRSGRGDRARGAPRALLHPLVGVALVDPRQTGAEPKPKRRSRPWA